MKKPEKSLDFKESKPIQINRVLKNLIKLEGNN